MKDTKEEKNSLRKKIREEMTADYSSLLEKNFDLAKQLIRISTGGKVDILNKDDLNGKEKILLYLIGKLYAREAGYTTTEKTGNKELVNELGIPEGSLLPWLKDLRDDRSMIRRSKKGRYSSHNISINWVERILKDARKKIANKDI